ncbi:hypothetical protein P9222_09035 [Paenibacillus amylolyticus]|nr:hypothetical protein [Paenibacillus amylolyticus]WFR64294.1 hypothetical protein P9222_09035 [Paenibacillus amylolyticus]
MKRKFLAAKVNINEGIFSDDVNYLIRLIPEVILSYPELHSNRSPWVWCFGELETDKERKVIWGNFVKKRNDQILIYEGSKASYQDIENVACQSFFLYNSETEILVFEETGDINRESFMSAFERIIYKGHIEIGEISVQLVPLKSVIKSKIDDIEVLTKIEFDLIHPNPIHHDSYKDLDDIIKKEQATRLKTTLENQNGLNKEGPFIQSGIEMVSKGYGDVNAFGYSRVQTYGKRKRIRKNQQRVRSKDEVQMTFAEKDIEKNELVSKLTTFAKKISSMLL